MSRKNGNKKSKELLGDKVSSPIKTSQKLGLSSVFFVGKNDGQKKAMETIRNHDVSVIYGWAGTGKSHIAMGLGLAGLLQGKYEKLLITRPYVEAGEHLGFLPGSFNSKIAPFMYPVIEIAKTLLGHEGLTAFLEKGNIEVMPLAYMRGVTFNNAFVVCDEAQNMSKTQMRMLLTRIGENSKLVITGDTEQSDLGGLFANGLADCIERLQSIEEIGFCELTEEHCVRSPLVSKIDKLYRNTPVEELGTFKVNQDHVAKK